MQKYNVAILGCGAIFSRHYAAIDINKQNFHLVGVFDPLDELRNKYASEYNLKSYVSENDVYCDEHVNCIAILSPNDQHLRQALTAIKHNKHVIIEKPATFTIDELAQIKHAALEAQVNVFCILQVRLNPTVQIAKVAIANGLLGNLRGASLVQRWQRPLDYFSGWRGSMASGGGVLREFAIHYLDALQFILNKSPKVCSATFFKNKFKNTDVADTVYALFDFDGFGGSMEISIAAEPENLECTLSIMGDNGFIKLGGKSLDEVVSYQFLDELDEEKFQQLYYDIRKQEVATIVNSGASPYHPELYRQIIVNPSSFTLDQTHNVIKIVEDIYSFS